MTVLVTGGCGFIGSRIVEALIERGEKAVAIDNFSRGRKDKLFNGGAYYCDVRDAQAVRDALGNVDEVIHAAYVNGTKTFYEQPELVLDVGVKGIVNLISACRYHRIKRFILISSSEVCRAQLVLPSETIPLVIPDPFNPRYSYSAGKIISEMMCIHSKVFERLIILRPFNIYGPGMAEGHVIPDFIVQAQRHKMIKMLGSGSETRSFCYIDDFITGFMLARDKGKHLDVFNIGTEDEISIRVLAHKVLEASGTSLRRIEEAGQLREGDAQRRKPDISKLRALGYEPKITLEDGLRRMMQWTQQQKPLPSLASSC